MNGRLVFVFFFGEGGEAFFDCLGCFVECHVHVDRFHFGEVEFEESELGVYAFVWLHGDDVYFEIGHYAWRPVGIAEDDCLEDCAVFVGEIYFAGGSVGVCLWFWLEV